jgi:hypothetical protein
LNILEEGDALSFGFWLMITDFVLSDDAIQEVSGHDHTAQRLKQVSWQLRFQMLGH